MKIEKVVAKGAKLLDKKMPGWFSKVKITKLEIDVDENCILGQLFKKDPYKGLIALGLFTRQDLDDFIASKCQYFSSKKAEKAILDHGFMFDMTEHVSEYNSFWKEAIKQRKTLRKQ